MVDRSSIAKALIIADRGYESYNLMAHIQEKGWKYLIRIKDTRSSGIASGLDLPDSPEFDVWFHLHFTKRQTAEAKLLLQDSNGTNGYRQPILLTSCHSTAKSMIRVPFTIFLFAL